ncbi:NFATC2-interacting protein isoform X1 [Takifugu rubripes]|uniref:NFATC2-interacting protein isoform X1 n=2 Tax=Takifugu rubripes TaxID=31033 RepID=UPI001145A525|nr:NFATC2-interacting protein isoform X1 [Takifugu rubripes]
MIPQMTDARKPLPRRRRILDPSTIVPVSVYSNKVSSDLQLRPAAAQFSQQEAADDPEAGNLWSHLSGGGRPPTTSTLILSDSEDEAEDPKTRGEPEAAWRSSPSPPTSPVRKHSRNVQKKIGEVDRMLQSLSSFLSPPAQVRKSSRRSNSPPPGDDDIIIVSRKDDDVIMSSPLAGSGDPPYSSLVREFPLKVRCRADLQKIPVLSSTPLSAVLDRLAVTLGVPRHRLLLLREEVELRADATVGALGLGIADIIECVVMAAEDRCDVITVRLQSKDRDTSQEFSLNRDTPLGSIFSQYLAQVSSCIQEKVCFRFDGSRVLCSQTPAQLDMEDGDIIEVWT